MADRDPFGHHAETNSTLTLKISVKPSEERLVGMFFVRLDNGFSVPISTELKK